MFRFILVITCLFFLEASSYNSEELIGGGGDFESVAKSDVDDVVFDLLDEVVEELDALYGKYLEDGYWHPYVVGTGNENREVIGVSNVNMSTVDGAFSHWAHARLRMSNYFVGMSQELVVVFGSNFETIFRMEKNYEYGEFTAIEAFSRWNEEEYHSEMVVLIATSTPEMLLYLFENNSLRNIGRFPLHYRVKNIQYAHVGLSSKVVLVPSVDNVALDIYNVDIGNSTQFWFFQRIPPATNQAVVVYDSDILDSVIAVNGNKAIIIYQYDQKEGMFDAIQTLPIQITCRQLVSFTIYFKHAIGCVPDPETKDIVRFLTFNYNSNEYLVESNDFTFPDIYATAVYTIPVHDYSDNYFFLVEDAQGVLRIMVHQGQSGFQTVYSAACSETFQCPKTESLSSGVGVSVNDKSVFAFPSDGYVNSVIWTIEKETQNVPSILFDNAQLLYDKYKGLSSRFQRLEKNTRDLEDLLSKTLNPNQDNIILDKKWDINNMFVRNLNLDDVRNTEVGELSVNNRLWGKNDSLVSPDELQADIVAVENRILRSKNITDDAVERVSSEIQNINAPITMNGFFQARIATIENLHVRYINDGITPTPYFDSLATNSSNTVVVQGELIFHESVSVHETLVSHIGKTPAHDIAQYSKNNTFLCPVYLGNGIKVDGSIYASTVNGIHLKEEIVLPSNLSGLHFVDGIVVSNNTNSLDVLSFDNVMLKSSPQDVYIPIRFDDVHIAGPLLINQINGDDFKNITSSIVTSNTSTIYGRKTVEGTVSTGFLAVRKTWNMLRFPTEFINNNERRVKLLGTKEFQSVNASRVLLKNDLNGISLDDFVLRDKPEVISRGWKFNGPVTVFNDIEVGGLVDGVNLHALDNKETLNDYRNHYNIYGDVEFEHELLLDEMKVQDSINGRNLTDVFNELLVFDGDICEIYGNTQLPNLRVSEVSTATKEINEMSTKKFLTTNSPNITVNGLELLIPVKFSELYLEGSYNGVNLSHIATNSIVLNETNVVDWEASFDSIQCHGNMDVVGPINNLLNFRKEVAVRKGSIDFQTIKGGVSFQSLTTKEFGVRNLTLLYDKSLDGLKVTAWNSTRLSLSRNEFIVSRFKAKNIISNTDIYAPIINNITLTRLQNYTLHSNSTSITFLKDTYVPHIAVYNGTVNLEQYLNGNSINDALMFAFPINGSSPLSLNGYWKFEDISLGEVNIGGHICGVDLNNLLYQSVRKNDTLPLTVQAKKSFCEIVISNELKASTLNGKAWDQVALLRGDRHLYCQFNGNNTFKFEEALISNNELINGIPMDSVTEAYRKNGSNHHIIHRNFKPAFNITAKNILVYGTIQQKNLTYYIHSILTTDKLTEIYARKRFLSPVHIQGNCEVHMYNNISMDEYSPLLLNRDIVLDNSIEFTRHVFANQVKVKASSVETEFLNNIPWNYLLNNAELITEPLGSHPRSFDHIYVNGEVIAAYIQGKKVDDLILLNHTQPISKLRINKLFINASEITVLEDINGKNIREEYENTIFKHEFDNSAITGNISLHGSVRILGNLQCFGESFKDNVVDITKPLNLSKPVRFHHKVNVAKHLNVSVPVHGVTVDDIMRNALTKDGEQRIVAPWLFKSGIIFHENVSGKGHVKNFDIKNLERATDLQLRSAGENIRRQKYRFLQDCVKIYNATQNLVSHPMKIDSFDRHQTITLPQKAEKLLHVNVGNTKHLLSSTVSCETLIYTWDRRRELYIFNSVELHLDALRWPVIVNWQSSQYLDDTILVFSSRSSGCSSLAEGLHFTTLNPSPVDDYKIQFSSVGTIVTGDVKYFELKELEETKSLGLFAITNSNTLKIWHWNDRKRVFRPVGQMEMNKATGFAVTVEGRSCGIVVTTSNNVMILNYDTISQQIDVITEMEFLAHSQINPVVFTHLDTLYAVVPINGSQAADVLGTSSVQVFGLINRRLEKLHQIHVDDPTFIGLTKFSGDILLSITSRSSGLNIYIFKGLSGFLHFNSYPIKLYGCTDVINYEVDVWHYSAPRPFIAIATEYFIEIFHGNAFGDSLDEKAKRLCST